MFKTVLMTSFILLLMDNALRALLLTLNSYVSAGNCFLQG